MTRVHFTFLITMLSITASAQKQSVTDSMYITTQATNSLKFIRTSATQLRYSEIGKFGIAGLTYERNKG
ncbi:MAG: hypothetical protein EOO92_10315, partial [Pedobacter sp.]